ncbi:MAG: hypothetical protein ABJF23_00490 [Bryobacteraceae bacterium]
MRTVFVTFVTLAALGISGCNNTVERSERVPVNDTDTASQKAGKVAHDIVKETDEAARKAGREIKKAAAGMKEGWKEAEREDPLKKKH